MIQFNSETKFVLGNQQKVGNWLTHVIKSEGYKLGDINYNFCDDDYLHNLNVKFLSHDTLTDIISFDYSIGNILHGEIFISIERVEENAKEFEVHFKNELNRVMVHGILHYCGYNDKTEDDAKAMRIKENFYLEQLTSFT